MRRLWLIVTTFLAFAAQADERRSGFDDMGAELQALQRDDGASPALLTAMDGEALWRSTPATGKPSCQSCHGDVRTLRGVATRYPLVDAASNRALDLAGRIALCRATHQALPTDAPEAEPLVALEAVIALQSRGLPIAPPDTAAQRALEAEGERLYRRRMGALNLSCAQCHDDHAGQRLGGSLIPQGHPTGYPLFRAEWQATGPLSRRLRNCMNGVRAEAYAADAPEWIALAAYLKRRAAGMEMDAPAVRP